MFLLDLSNDILLDILALVDPVDLLNICNVSKRLRDLADWTLNNGVLKLHLTGIDCFPNIKSLPFHNMDRLRVNTNWLNGEFRRTELFTDYNVRKFWGTIVVDDHIYTTVKNEIRKYDRLWNGGNLSSEFKLIGEQNDKFSRFAKKDNVIFAGGNNGTCKIFQDEEPIINAVQLAPNPIRNMDLSLKNDVYVTCCGNGVQILNKKPNDSTLSRVDEINDWGDFVKIDPLGEKLITGHGCFTILYDFNTKIKENLDGLKGLLDLLWKDNQTVLAGHVNGSLTVYDMRTKSICQRIESINEDLVSIEFDGQNAVICGFKYSKILSINDLRMNKVLKEFNLFNEEEPDAPLLQVVADHQHLFVMTEFGLQICDFSV